MAYSFYLDKVLLPVAPSKLQIKIGNQNKTLTLINDGEVNVLKTAGLTEITFDVLIPQVLYPFTVYKDGFKDASYFLELFERLKSEKKPFQFIVSRMSPGGKLLFDTNIKVSLETYTITEDAGNGLDLVVPVALKQYREFATKTVTVKKDGDKSTAEAPVKKREVTKTPPKTYTVASGDTLWTICKKQLGDGSSEKCQQIAKLNGIKDPSKLTPGQVIKLG